MNQNNEFLSIISKIMDESAISKSPNEHIYDDIYDKIFSQLIIILDEGKYLLNSDLIKEIDFLMNEFEILNKMEFLIGKTLLRISGDTEKIFKFIFNTEEAFDIVTINRNIPLFIIKGKFENKIYILNYVNKLIEITNEEYRIIQKLYLNNIEIRKLIKSFICFSKEYKYENIVTLIIPEYTSQEAMEYIKKLKKYIEKELFIPYKKNMNKENKDLIKKLFFDKIKYILDTSDIENYEERFQLDTLDADKILKKSEIEMFLYNQNMKNINMDLSIQFKNILLDIDLYYYNLKKKQLEKMEILAKDLINADENSKIRNEIKEYREYTKIELNNIEKNYQEFQVIKEEIIKVAKEYTKQNFIFLEDSTNNLKKDIYEKEILEIIFKLTKIENYKEIRNYISKLKKIGYKYCLELEIFLNALKRKKIDQNEKLKIINISNEVSEFSKIKMILSDKLGYSENDLKEIAKKIPENLKEGKENYYLAKLAYDNNQYIEAMNKYKKALKYDYGEAGKELINILKKDEKYDINLEELAENLIPEANYEIGIRNIKTKYKKGIVNLKMAASKDYIEAIEYIANLLFDKYKRLSWKDVVFANDEDEIRKTQDDKKIKENQKNINNIIMLYSYLKNNNYKAKYDERIGLMLCKIGNYSSALEILKNLDTVESNYQCGKMYQWGEGTAQDLEKSKIYFEKIINRSGNFKGNDLKILEKSKKDYQKVCEWIKTNNKKIGKKSYSSRSSYRYKGSSCCYIITATCMALGINRDKNFLNMLRKFRNSYLRESKNDILEYYKVSPEIANKIDREWNPFIIYQEIWDDYIKPSIEEMKKDNWKEAQKIYNEMIRKLCEEYSMKVKKSIAEKYNIKLIRRN